MSLMVSLSIGHAEPVLRGRDHLWSVIRSCGRGGTFTVSDLVGRTNGQSRGSVWSYVDLLRRAGIVEALPRETKRGRPTVYRLRQAPCERPAFGRDGRRARHGRCQRQIWNVLRGPAGRAGLTARELALYASTEDVPVSARTAVQYLRILSAGGYLLATRPDRGERRWRLKPSMNSGPRAPRILSTRILYDANRREVMGPTLAREIEP